MCSKETQVAIGLCREFTWKDRRMIEELILKQSEIWDSSEPETALELIRLLLHWIEENELTRKEVDHSAINEMYVGWYRLKTELIRKEKLIARDGR